MLLTCLPRLPYLAYISSKVKFGVGYHIGLNSPYIHWNMEA